MHHVGNKKPAACLLLVYDPEYLRVAAYDDAAGNNKRDDEQSCFGRVAIAVFQDGAGPQLSVQTEHTCNVTHSGGYFYVALHLYLQYVSH
jgi:hypothetical protein